MKALRLWQERQRGPLAALQERDPAEAVTGLAGPASRALALNTPTMSIPSTSSSYSDRSLEVSKPSLAFAANSSRRLGSFIKPQVDNALSDLTGKARGDWVEQSIHYVSGKHCSHGCSILLPISRLLPEPHR